MNSRATSDVHIMTGKTPVTNVESHRSKTSGSNKEQCRSSLSQTNQFLKKGGTLPSVLPSGGDCNPAPSHSLKNRNVHSAFKSKMTVSHNKKTQVPIMKDSSTQPTQDTCELEKKMENLSCKLSKVQDILLSQMVDAVESTTHTPDKNDTFSAHDYTLLVLEMNGNVSAHPYDPFEFSEKDQSIEATAKRTSFPVNGNASKSVNSRSNILLTIRDELSNWRAKQGSSDGDFFLT